MRGRFFLALFCPLLVAHQALGQVELVFDINPGSAPSRPGQPVRLGEWLYFAAEDDTHGRELWATDGTTTRLVADINPGPTGSDPGVVFSTLTVFQDRVYFPADDGVHGFELWTTDGTTTEMVADVNPGSSAAFYWIAEPGLTEFQGHLYFGADDGQHGRELWATDGVKAWLVADVRPGPAGSAVGEPEATPDLLYFAGYGSGNEPEIWTYDGSTASFLIAPPRLTHLVSQDSRVYFWASLDDEHGKEVWVIDKAAVELVADINPGIADAYPGTLFTTGFVGLEEWLYFAARDPAHGIELWRTDGTGAELVDDLYAGADSSLVAHLTAGNGWLYFAATDGQHGRELWRTDGQTALLVADVVPGAEGSSPTELAFIGSHLYFAASDEEHGRELWVTDGGTTTFVGDINPGSEDAYPRHFASLSDWIYFRADDGEHGSELWRVRSSSTPTEPEPEGLPLLSLTVTPNPAGQEVRLRYAIPTTSHVWLEVFDTLGRRVAVVVDGTFGAGMHTAAFNTGGLPGGVYLFRLASDGLTRTRRVTLLR